MTTHSIDDMRSDIATIGTIRGLADLFFGKLAPADAASG